MKEIVSGAVWSCHVCIEFSYIATCVLAVTPNIGPLQSVLPRPIFAEKSGSLYNSYYLHGHANHMVLYS